MYENAFNQIERELRNEAGIANELDYVEQISWVLFLKYLHDLEVERRDRAELGGEGYTPLVDPDFGWGDWAAPRTAEGGFDHNEALIGDDLIAFVDRDFVSLPRLIPAIRRRPAHDRLQDRRDLH